MSVTGMLLASLVLVYAAAADTIREAPVHALILGGGGPVGEAWESGVIAGLMEKGVDLAAMDRVIGTSAGAVWHGPCVNPVNGSSLAVPQR